MKRYSNESEIRRLWSGRRESYIRSLIYTYIREIREQRLIDAELERHEAWRRA